MYLTVEKLKKYTLRLNAYRLMDAVPILPMAAMESGNNTNQIHVHPPETVQGMELGLEDDFKGRDRYVWLRKNICLPEHRNGCLVAGYFDFGKTGGGHNSGFESLLYVDRQPYQGVDSNHKDVDFESFAGREVELTILLWTGLEGGGTYKIQHHRVQYAHIGYLHCATDGFYYFSKTIGEAVTLLPDTAPEKHALIAALDRAYHLINWDADKFHHTVGAALDSLTASLDKMEKHTPITVRAVGHTHIDVAWLWRLKHTREKVIRSFTTVMRLMSEFDDYIFLQSQPQLYKFVQKDCPALYTEIKKRAKEGRWETDGGMWVEADCNISSGEALIRQLLYGIKFFKDEFGKACEYLWLPDVFGYSWALPQILKGFGIQTFVTTKISWNQYNSMPHDVFRWRGIDGTEILTYFITTPNEGDSPDARFTTYNGMMSPETVLGGWYKFRDKNLSNEILISYGYGDGGGGVNRDMLKARRVMDALPGLPQVKATAARDFFRRLHTQINETDQYVHTWDGELYLEYHRGTYTSQANNKRYNRMLENALMATEWLSVLNRLSGAIYPQNVLQDAWECVLLHQFHDIIPGSSIREVYEDSDTAYAETEARVTSITQQALSGLTETGADTFTLYHSGSFARTDTVLIPVIKDGCFYDGDMLLPAQRIENGWLITAEMEPLSMKTVVFKAGASINRPSSFIIDMEAGMAESPLYTVTWNSDGNLSGLYDRRYNRPILDGIGNVLELYEDKPLGNDNWDIDIYYTQKRETSAQTTPPQLLEDGPERCVIRFSHQYNNSLFVRDMILYRDCPRIDFCTSVEWAEKDRLLKVAFPVLIRSTKATYDIQFGHVERPTHFNTSWDWARFEVVGHKWADLSEADYGVSLLNDCKYGYNIKDHILRLTLLKSTKYPDTDMDMGTHHFTYALLPHAGTVTESDTIEESVKLNLPVQVVEGRAIHTGHIVKVTGNARLVHLDAIKKAEKEDCYILRVHECRGARGDISITSDYPLIAYAYCNLLEETLGEVCQSSEMIFTIQPFEIKTFKLWFNRV